MDSTKGSLSSLAGRTIAQLRALARNSPLANVYSRQRLRACGSGDKRRRWRQ